MPHKYEHVADFDYRGSNTAGSTINTASGATQVFHEGYADGHKSTPLDPSSTASPKACEGTRNTDEKVFFAVLDITDGRRYKVFIRYGDIPRLKVGKIRKTLSAVAGKPPFSFDLWHRDVLLRGTEGANCADLGITPQTVLVMRPIGEERSANVGKIEEQGHEGREFLGNAAGGDDGEVKNDAFTTGFSVKHTCDVVKRFDSIGNDSSYVVELNERQRALQTQLYEEAKRSNLFSTTTSNEKKTNHDNNDNDPKKNNKNNSDYGILGHAVRESVLRYEEALPDEIGPEHNSDNEDGFTDFMQEIVNNKVKQPISDMATPTFPSQDGSPTVASATHSLDWLRNNTSSLDVVLQGEHYSDMYCEGDNRHKEVFSSSTTPTDVHSLKNQSNKTVENKQSECEAHVKKSQKDASSYATMATDSNIKVTVSDREEQLTNLVQHLQDDVSELLSLQARGETTKRALQQALVASQERVLRLQEREQQSQLQIASLLAVLRCGPDGSPQPLTEAELRAAVQHTTALYQSEVLRRENTALERRLAQEVRRRRDMALTLEDMKGHIRVLVRVRPPMRVLQRGQHPNTSEIERTTTAGSVSQPVVGVVVADGQRNTVTVTDPFVEPRQFHFYRVFSAGSTQVEVFGEVVPLVQLACDGVNVSVLAYGQTGSGKTYTIFGPEPQGNTTVTEKNTTKQNNNSDDDDVEKGEEEEEEEEEEEIDVDDGIVPRTMRVLFQHLRAEAAAEMALMTQHGTNGNSSNKSNDIAVDDEDDEEVDLSRSSMFEVSCSLVEMYNDRVRDLLASPQPVVPTFHVSGSNANKSSNHKSEGVNPRGPISVAPQRTVRVGPDGRMYVVGLTQHVVRTAREALRVLRDGSTRRQVQATQQNSSSSRSHMIFTVHLSQRRRAPVQCMSAVGNSSSASTSGRSRTKYMPVSSVTYRCLESKLVFVDLAGSERIAKSQSTGDRLKEVRYINKSLAALGDVVSTLSNNPTTATTNPSPAATGSGGATHVPYRNSMLTALLQDVIGNRSKTVLLACVAPSDPPYENHTAETATTLQFASRVRCVRNFAPPFPTNNSSFMPPQSQSQQPAATSTTTVGGDGGCTKCPNANTSEADVDPSYSARTVARGGKNLWMRPTASSLRRVNAV